MSFADFFEYGLALNKTFLTEITCGQKNINNIKNYFCALHLADICLNRAFKLTGLILVQNSSLNEIQSSISYMVNCLGSNRCHRH